MLYLLDTQNSVIPHLKETKKQDVKLTPTGQKIERHFLE